MPRCPECGNRLYYRRRAEGYVCKNWRCKNYWKRGRGYFDKAPVFQAEEETKQGMIKRTVG